MTDPEAIYIGVETAWLEMLEDDEVADESDDEYQSDEEEEKEKATDDDTKKDEPIRQTPRESALSMETRDWDDPIPKATPETIQVADYFKTHSQKHHFGDILHELRRDNLEYQRLDLTFFISVWFPNTEPETWISLACIGASDFAVSSLGRPCNVKRRKLLALTPHGPYFNVTITFDNELSKWLPLQNLVAVAFWRFPLLPGMTVDHNNRQTGDHVKDNLSWETKHVQIMNRSKSNPHTLAVVRLDPITLDETGSWDSARQAAEDTGGNRNSIFSACRSGSLYKGFFWIYREEIREGEIFKTITIPPGLEEYEISTHSRVRTLNGHITSGHIGSHKYPVVTLINNILKAKKTYVVHILTALNHVQNPNPDQFKLVNHKDKNRGNGHISNLEWTNSAGNMQHAYETEHASKRPVNFLDKNRVILTTYPSMIEASRKTNIEFHLIHKQCRILKMTDGETFFEYADPTKEYIINQGYPVVQLDLFTEEVLFIWPSSIEAERYTGISSSLIRKAKIGGNEGITCGFAWRDLTLYEAPMDPKGIEDLNILKNKGVDSSPKKIVEIQIRGDKETVMNIYESLREAERKTGIPRKMIAESCAGIRDSYNDDRPPTRFLFQEDYEHRDPNDPLIKNHLQDDLNRPIVVMNLEGKVISEHINAKEAGKSVRKLAKCGLNLYPSRVIRVARGIDQRVGNFRFAFKSEHMKDPESYTKNLHPSIRNKIYENSKH